MTEKSGEEKYKGTGSNPASHQALADNRAATQFDGERANPKSQDAGSNKPWSVRNSLRDMANRHVDEEEVTGLTEDQAIRKILPSKRVTLVQIGAARQLVRFAKGNGNEQFVTDQLDGKLAQTNINADFAAIQGMTEDELQEIIKNPHAFADSGGGDSGAEAAEGSSSAADR